MSMYTFVIYTLYNLFGNPIACRSLALTLALAVAHSLALTQSRSLTLSLSPRRSRKTGVWRAEPPRRIFKFFIRKDVGTGFERNHMNR